MKITVSLEHKCLVIVWLLSATIPSLSLAADIEAGKTTASICAACHGLDGIGITPLYPNLAGQKAAYLAKQLQAFKNGERKDQNMSVFAIPLSDSDIDNLAAYYESLPAGGGR